MKAPLHFVSQRVMGFSLVELMVAMTLGLLLMFGVVQVFDSTRQANRTNDALGQLQENGRLALSLITRDLREAGSLGCNRVSNIDIRGLPPAITGTYATRSLQGFTALASPPVTTVPMVAGTQGIYLMGMADGATSLAADMATQNAPIAFRAGGRWTASDRLILSDCLLNGAAADVFPAPAANIGAAGVIPSPGRLSVRYPDFAIIGPLFAREYFISDGAGADVDGVRTLYRRDLAPNPVDTAALVDGVHDMRFRYGIDNNADGEPDAYAEPPAAINWANVVSVEISLLLRDTAVTAAQNATDRQTYTFPSWAAATTTAPAGDFHLYTVMGTTVALRNRIP